jgi:HIRAN domain-containing protein
MRMRTIVCKVSGVTFDNRQDIIAKLSGKEPCRIQPEPSNKYDPHALAVLVAMPDGTIAHVGYVPKSLAAQVSPWLEGEAVMSRILEIVGGFETEDGDTAAFGLRIAIDLPDDKPIAADRT